jgi:poly(3-hydroxybutyrate) depolymerase
MRTFVHAFMLGLGLLSFNGTIFSQQVAKTIPNSTSPDGLIGFLEFKPKDYGTQQHPLIIFLHGIGERGNGTSQINSVAANAIPKFCAAGATMRFTVGGQTSSFVVLSPQLSSSYGYWPTYYIKEMIKYAKANLQIDPNRIYITGLSLGGGGIWRAITEVLNADFSFDAGIAAAAPVCGTQEESDPDIANCVAANHLPLWAFHSMDDGTVAVNATQHAEILTKAANVTPTSKYTYYQSGGHGGAWINAYDTGHITTPVVVNGAVSNFTANPNLYEWFLSNSRSTTQTNYTVPVANAGAAQTITLPVSTITLTGSGSGTNGATVSSYSWAKTSGPSGGTISLPLLNTTAVTGLVQGTYVFTLTVTDNHGLSSTSNVTITVNSLINQSPVANPGSNISITLPTSSTTLNGSASSDPDGTISTYAWSQTSGSSSSTIANTGSATTAVSNLVQGTYVFTLKVTDNAGATATSTVSVTVNAAAAAAANQYPIANPGVNRTITLPATLTLDASGSTDPDGSIVTYRWTETAGPTGPVMTTRDAKTTDVTGLLAGTYTFVLQVTDNGGLQASASVLITVNAATTNTTNTTNTATQGSGNLLGYIKMSIGYYQACGDPSTSGRMAIYGSSLANGNVVYTNAAQTQIYNGGWNWYSLTSTLGGTVSCALSVFPDGTIHMLNACPGSIIPVAPAAPVTPPVTPAVTPPVTTPTGNLLGYIKMSVGYYQACGDPSSSSRIAVYGSSIANGTILYTDAAQTQIYNGGWNWFSFTPTLGGAVTYAFAIYPSGGIFLLRSCASGSRVVAGTTVTTTVEQDEATLRSLKDSANASILIAAKESKLKLYPNPVHTTATIEIYSAENAVKTIHLYNASGVLKATYTWQTTKGNNTFSLKAVAGLANGLYIIDIRDSNGKSSGSLKFLKM